MAYAHQREVKTSPLLLILLLAACHADRESGAQHELSLADCEVAGAPALCGHLLVPEDWDRPEGRTIALNIMVIPASDAVTQPPLFDLAGGPGLPATPGAVFYVTEGSAYHKNRDIVLVDQRGTGESAPAFCPGIGHAGSLAPLYPLEGVRMCLERLSRTHDLTQYSSPSSVRDLEAVRAAIGAEQVDLFGVSYGTRLAQAYIRAYPGKVRSAVFVGTVRMDLKAPLPHATNAESAVQAIFEDCEKDPACADAFPALRRDWEALGRKLRRNEVLVSIDNESRAVAYGPFMEAFRTILLTPAGQRKVPALITAVSAGDTADFVAMVSGDGPMQFAEGVYLSIECTEGTNRIVPEEIDEATGDTFLGRYRVEEQMRACSIWPATNVPESFFEPVASDVPVLLVVGGRDYVTPAAYSEAVASHFGNSQVLVVEEMGHVLADVSNLECIDGIMLHFYAEPRSTLDTACVDEMRAPAFELRANQT